jgi:methylated-DNA-[protein]-cysteine S-methyltransferase
MKRYEYRSLRTPIGVIYLVGDGERVERIAFRKSEFAAIRGEVVNNPKAYPQAVRELHDYFDGKLKRFSFPISLAASDFKRSALLALKKVRYGETVSYRELATRAGSPRAFRAAGSACATNPLPIVVPCHRVLKSDGSLGNYGGGLHVKRMLLALEGVKFK